jgi:hypothetical protein
MGPYIKAMDSVVLVLLTCSEYFTLARIVWLVQLKEIQA